MRSRQISVSPELVFLVLGLLAGGLMCVLIPFGAGFDEETHLVRVYDLAGLHWLPNRSAGGGSYAPGEFFSLSYQRRALLSPAQDLLGGDAFTRKIDRNNPTLIQTRSIYPPPGLAVQAVLARLIWLKYDVPVVPGTIALRLAGLGLYLLGTWLAVRLLPLGKWVLAVLALAPMALFEAATVNVDGFNNAISFLFIALVLRIVQVGRQPLRWREVICIFGLSLLQGLAKPSAILILPLLFLLFRRRSLSKWQMVVLVIGSLLAFGLMIGWNSLALAGSHFDTGGEQSASRQLDWILADPIQFGVTLFRGNLTRVGGFFQDWVGVYGHWVGEVPAAIYILYPLALAGALLAEPRRPEFSRGQRFWVAGVFLAAAAGIELVYFAANYIPGDASSLGRQGRYFTPFAPLLYLALTGLVSWRINLASWMRGLSLVILVGVLALYGYGLYATYYTYCSATVYTGKTCVQPVYKNLDRESAPEILLTRDAPLTQSFTSVCGEVTSVEVLVRSVPETRDGRIRLSLLTKAGGYIATREAGFAEIHEGQYFRLSLDAPTRVAGGKEADKFGLLVELLPGMRESGPGFAVTYRDDYPAGSLAIGGNERSTDLIFHYSCAVSDRAGSR